MNGRLGALSFLALIGVGSCVGDPGAPVIDRPPTPVYVPAPVWPHIVSSTSTVEVPSTTTTVLVASSPPLDKCAEMETYRVAAGLPARFGASGHHQRWTRSDGLGWRESKCGNNEISQTGCCVGYWQIGKVVFNDWRVHPRAVACGATWSNIRGETVGAKTRQACVAKALYDIVGLSPWRPT